MDETISGDLEVMLLLPLQLLVLSLLPKPLGVGGDLMVNVCNCVELMAVIDLSR